MTSRHLYEIVSIQLANILLLWYFKCWIFCFILDRPSWCKRSVKSGFLWIFTLFGQTKGKKTWMEKC